MSNCGYCNKGFSCGCQKTKAKDGTVVHKTCKQAYEASGFQKASTSSDPLTKKINEAKNNLK